jgi:hypothetical protein
MIMAVASTASLLLSSILIIIYLTTPLYILRGDANGYIGFAGYYLEAFGERLRSPMLDSLRIYTAPIYISSSVALITSALSITRYMRRRGFSIYMLAMLLGSAGILIISVGILAALSQIVERVLAVVASSYSHETSAGRIIYGGTEVYEAIPRILRVLISQLPYTSLLMLTAILVIQLFKKS